MSRRNEVLEHPVAARWEEPLLPALALGLRLLALAMVAAAALVLPLAPMSRSGLALGLLAGGSLGLLEYRRARHGGVVLAVGLVGAQLALWTLLTAASGAERSPLFVGFLLEVPLAALALAHGGACLAALGGGLGYLGASYLAGDVVRWPAVLLVTLFLCLAAGICGVLASLWRRQQRELASSRAALAARAGSLSEELRLLGDYLGGALVVLDELGRVVRVNAAGLDLLGVAGATPLGRAWQEVLALDAAGAAVLTAALAEGEARRGAAVRLMRPDGTTCPFIADLWLTTSAEGRRLHLLLEPARAGAAAADPLQRIGEAVSCVAHQIRNSLHALKGYVREIERGAEVGAGPGGPGPADAGFPYLSALESLGALADDILALAGATRPVAERLALRPLLATAVLLARRANSAIRVDITGDNARVLAPRGPLVHALFNLLDNACRVTRPGRAVRVRVERQGEGVLVEIEDGGEGMPPGLAAASGRTASAQGLGLGLLAARRFLAACGGHLEFAPAAGRGTLCRVTLPGDPAAWAGASLEPAEG